LSCFSDGKGVCMTILVSLSIAYIDVCCCSQAPLFVLNVSASANPDDLMRLPVGYNMHHLYRYETMNWEMFAVHRFKELDPPFVSVTFPIAPALKVRGTAFCNALFLLPS
jgi:hypothetical protein